VDARPSDAIALAVAGNTPIFVEDHVLNEVAGPGQAGESFNA
jgi:bifunctional DNase/RNase